MAAKLKIEKGGCNFNCNYMARGSYHRTQFWKGAIQEQFHQSLVAIGPVVSEEKIKM
jgi:hypothetical protein